MSKKKKQIVNPFAVDMAGLVHFPICDRQIYPITKKDKIKAIREFIRENFTKRQTINRAVGSYRLKHIVERCLGYHVSNGELITAMLKEGYSIQPYRYGSLNCWFNVGVSKNLFDKY